MATPPSDRSVDFTATLGRPVLEVGRLFALEAADVIGGVERPGTHQVVIDLEVPLGGHGTVTRPAVVTTGTAEFGDDRFRLPITVAALDSDRWFPTFNGVIVGVDADLGETRLSMSGVYELPLGIAGRVSGPIGGDRAARSSLYVLFLGIAVGAERALRERAPAWRPAPVGSAFAAPERLESA